jgi:hypothetical protein
MTQYNYDRRRTGAKIPAWIWVGLAFVVLVLLASTCAGCVRDGGNGWQATATYGAEQYHLQLTAQADGK